MTHGRNLAWRGIIITVIVWFAGCSQDTGPGDVIFTENSVEHFVVLGSGRPGYVKIGDTVAKERPDLRDLREVHGDLRFIFAEIHGIDKSRIVVEASDKKCYQAVFQRGDREALKLIAKPLGPVVTREERELPCLTNCVLYAMRQA
jgi:hypothetical protein